MGSVFLGTAGGESGGRNCRGVDAEGIANEPFSDIWVLAPAYSREGANAGEARARLLMLAPRAALLEKRRTGGCVEQLPALICPT